jgi:RNA polymerase sigma-70 factor (ECF subfamily)
MNDFRSRVQGERAYLVRYASLRTWLTAILKHKIVDAIRRMSREAPAATEDDFEALFDERGRWIEPPAAWSDPGAALEQKGFFAALEMCLRRLPEKTSQAFLMREHLGLEADEICKELAVTPTHCWVLLYRARIALRECLTKEWFGKS